MLKKDSILSIITLSFAISMIVILLSFYILNKNLSLQEYRYIENRVSYFNQKPIYNISNELKNLGYKMISNQKDIIQNAKVIYETKRGKKQIKYLKYNKLFYLYIQTPNNKILLLDKKFLNYDNTTLFLIFSTIMLIFISLYILILKKFLPIKKLLLNVKNLANENFDINFNIKGNDEIAVLAKEFKKSVKKLKELKLSRNIFVRNIMHELKTPITKGKLLLAIPDNKHTKEDLEKVFYRLQSLLDEFTQIENFLSINKQINSKTYFLDDLVDSAIDISLHEERSIKKEYKNIRLNVDFKLFIIALKNLIDNGIKYSKTKSVTIKNDKDSILIINQSEALNYPLEKYFEPSYDEKSNKLKLGIYITNYILKENSFKLTYKHEKDTNIFTISPYFMQ